MALGTRCAWGWSTGWSPTPRSSTRPSPPVRIAEGAPLVARWHKRFARRLLQPEPISAAELDESFHCFATEDFRAGYQAFLAKAKPEFRGR